MATVQIDNEYNNFIKGLVTEAGPLTFPEGASLAEENFELNRKGYRQRRLGMDFEPSFELGNVYYDYDLELIGDPFFPDQNIKVPLLATTLSPVYLAATSSYLWEAPGNNSELSYVIVQVGKCFHFYLGTNETVSPSRVKVTANTLKNVANDQPLMCEGDANVVASYSTINGKLVIASGGEVLTMLEVTDTPHTFNLIRVGINVRDIWGIDDGYDLSSQPLSVPVTDWGTAPFTDDEVSRMRHLYNVNNQGFVSEDIITYAGANAQAMPANNQSPSTGIDTSDNNTFKPARYTAKSLQGRTNAARGSSVLDIFYRGASRENTLDYDDRVATHAENNWWEPTPAYGWTTLKMHGTFGLAGKQFGFEGSNKLPFEAIPRDRSVGKIIDLTSYAERMFYLLEEDELIDGDANSPIIENMVFFSQTVTSTSKVGRCYQEGDPTSFEEFDLLATDGGTITIADMGKPLKILSLSSNIVVIATRGVWVIDGGETGFSAVDFSVSKISDMRVLGKESIVVAEDSIFLWGRDGIFVISSDQTTGLLTAKSVTENTIQGLYNDLGVLPKTYAKGHYIANRRQVVWMYSTSSISLEKDNILVLDLILGAFSQHKLGDPLAGTTHVGGMVDITPQVQYIDVGTTYGNTTFTDSDDDSVDVPVLRRHYAAASHKFITFTTDGSVDPSPKLTFSDMSNNLFRDWGSKPGGGVDAPAYLMTGWNSGGTSEGAGDNQRDKQLQYITTHMKRTETGFTELGEYINPSSCLMSAFWDNANTPRSGKVTDFQQVYRLNRPYFNEGVLDTFDYGQLVITTKNRIRGRGKNLLLKFKTEPGKDCILYGWGTVMKGNTGV